MCKCEEDEQVKRSFKVEVDILTQHSYIVDDVNSQEEAEMIVEELIDDGEEGEVSNKEVFSMDSYPIDSKEEFN